MLKVEYLGRIEYDFQKSRVTGPWDHKDSVSAKKENKISCLCTLSGGPAQHGGQPGWLEESDPARDGQAISPAFFAPYEAALAEAAQL